LGFAMLTIMPPPVYSKQFNNMIEQFNRVRKL